MKRVLSLLIAAIMVFSMMPAMTFMSLAEEVPTSGPMDDPGKVFVFSKDVNSKWRTIGPQTPFQVIGDGGVYNNGATYDCYYNNAGMVGVLFEVANVSTSIRLSNNSLKAGTSANTNGKTESEQVCTWYGYDKITAGGDAIEADGIYMYLAQPVWWTQQWYSLYCTELSDLSFVTSEKCSMRVLGIVEVTQSDSYMPNPTSNITYVRADDNTISLGAPQTSTITTGWENAWSDAYNYPNYDKDPSSPHQKPIVKKVAPLMSEYKPVPSEGEEFDGWMDVDTKASVTCAAGQFTVYPTMKATPNDPVTVKFMNDEIKELDIQTVTRGAKVTYEGPEPIKPDEGETTYLFRGWKNEADETGDFVDLETYTTQTDVTLTAVFTPATKTKVVLEEKERAGFNKPGRYGIKLNRNDITFPDGSTTIITRGTVTVSSKYYTNVNNENTFTVTFTADENGAIDLEFELKPPADCLGQFDVDFSGSVTGADGASDIIFKTTESISNLGVDQQPGKYYGNAGVTLLNKNEGDVPGWQNVWWDYVDFGRAQPGITFVMNVTGIDEPVILNDLNTRFVTNENPDNYFDRQPLYWKGATEPFRYMTISENGYYLLYFNNKLFDNKKIRAVKELGVFYHESGTNRNANAAIQMLAVVGGDLQPTITVHNADDTVTKYPYKYTDVGETSDDENKIKQTMKLVTVGEAIEKMAVPKPVKDSDGTHNYTFEGWATDKEGTKPANLDAPLYMSTDLYPIFKEHNASNKYTVTFMNGNAQCDEQQISEGNYATAPANPTKDDDDTGTFTFEGWSLTNGGGVDSVVTLENYPITKDTVFYAVYTHVDVTYTVTYKDNFKEDGDKLIKTETVVRSKPATPPIMKNKYDKYHRYHKGSLEWEQKNADVKYYVFKEWADENGVVFDKNNVTSDVTVYAQYTTLPITEWCHVYWRNENDVHIWDSWAAYGDYAEGPSIDGWPLSEGRLPKHNTLDENYLYTVKGWDQESVNVTGDMVIKPVYDKTPIPTGEMPYKTEKVTRNIGEKNVLWNEETTLDKAYNGVTVMLRMTATPDTPVRIGGVFAEADGGHSNTYWMKLGCGDEDNNTPVADQQGLISVTDDKWHYITLGANAISTASAGETEVMQYFAIDDPSDSTCAPSTGTGSYEAYMFMGGYNPTVRFYAADKTTWLQTQQHTVSYSSTDVKRGELVTPESLYKGTLPDGFLYWADAEGNRVTEVFDNMDVYAVFDSTDKEAIANYNKFGFTVGNTLALNVNLTCNEFEETYTMCDTWTMYLDAETEAGVWKNIDSQTLKDNEKAENVTFNLMGIPAAYISSNLRVRFEGRSKYGVTYTSQQDQMIVYDGGEPEPISFVNYSKKVKEQEKDEKLNKLLNSMLNYAAEVQKYKGFKADPETLANKDLTEEEQNVKSIADSDYDWTPYAALKRGITSYENKAVKIKSSQLLLGTDKVGFRFHFNAQGEDVSTLAAKVKYTENGNTVEKEISAFTVVSEANGDYYATFEGLDPTSFSTQVEVSVYRNGEKVSNTAYDSIPQMAHQVAKDDKHVNMRPVLSTLLVYSNEAQNYVAQ